MRSACTPRREVKRVRQATVCHTCPTSAQTAGPLTSPEAMARRQAFAPSPHPAGGVRGLRVLRSDWGLGDRKSTRLNSSHVEISYAVFCLKKKTRSEDRSPAKKTTNPVMIHDSRRKTT